MPPKCKFAEGEKVLCFHGPLIYEAKCLKFSVTKEKQIKYFIHYAGWNKNWDEWVPENRVLKYNEANVQKQKEVQRTHQQLQGQKTKKSTGSSKIATRKSEGSRDKSDKDSDSRASTPIPALEKPTTRPKYSSATPTQESSSEPPRKKRGRIDQSECDEYHAKTEVKITIPDVLKAILADDSELILKQKKLCSLPARISVDNILKGYVQSKDKSNKESALEVTKGIKEYFNVTLGLQLLYKWERPQYEDIMSEYSEAQPSQIYGAFHLLRLFVELGNILSYTQLDERSVQILLGHFHDFLQYLEKNNSLLFNLQVDYEISTPDYFRKYMQL